MLNKLQNHLPVKKQIFQENKHNKLTQQTTTNIHVFILATYLLIIGKNILTKAYTYTYQYEVQSKPGISKLIIQAKGFTSVQCKP